MKSITKPDATDQVTNPSLKWARATCSRLRVYIRIGNFCPAEFFSLTNQNFFLQEIGSLQVKRVTIVDFSPQTCCRNAS